MQRIPPELTNNARALRNAATPAERALWNVLRGHRPRFTRQLVFGHFILDLACRSARIAIELDGGHHGSQSVADNARTAYLASHGWTVLRFWNSKVFYNLPGVMAVIDDAVTRASTHPRPLPSREGS
ncbi:endonuclease domain-containing protein [Sphingomonas baiyangensis]|uniref:DUF559 domain-containing protein n=1 Tax=Sphingomonas baiyangensis TaxID=2572576 RepID=A0A4U1L4M4_9SPHN|nr:DUF559 domain-containing protein [Sphingomonas baiyangensis]TKD51145.1 DUF559 domain-containing protein [Sphingomonas baiyangensis]